MSVSHLAFRLGEWTVRPGRCTISNAQNSAHVTPKSMAVLECLANADGEVVSRNELFESVWPNSAVTDDVLTQCVVELRKAFGDSARDPKVIETVPKKGFRLVPPVSGSVAGAGTETNWRRGIRTGLIVAGLAAVVASTFWFLLSTRLDSDPVSSTDPTSLAVLPFVDASPTGDQTHFADGITDDLTVKLAGLDDLLVVGRTSSFLYGVRADDIETIADDLNVRYILEGSVRRSREEIRVTAQLIDTHSGYQVWGETYDRPLEDIFAVQDELASAVARALSIKLSVGFLKDAGTKNVEAFEAFWLGFRRRDAGTDTAQDYLRRTEHLIQATRLDPEWAFAWAVLAHRYHYGRFWLADTYRWQEPALEALRQAHALDPESPTVARVQATVHTTLGNWREAETSVRRLDLLRATGRALSPDKAAALGIPPDDFAYWNARLELNAKTGRANQSIDDAERLRVRYPTNALPQVFLGHLYAMLGKSERAIEIFDDIPSIADGLTASLGTGDQEFIQPRLKRMVEAEKTIPSWRGVNATMAEMIDDRDVALVWLREAHDQASAPDFWIAIWAGYHGGSDIAIDALRRSRDGWAMWLPVLADVRKSSGFVNLVHEIGLVDYWAEFGWGDFCAPSATGEIVCR